MLILLAATVIAGCAVVKDYADVATRKGLSEEYRKILTLWTREETLFSQFETRLKVTAVYKSPAFRNAYRAELDRLYRGQQMERDVEVPAMSYQSSDSIEFFFYAYTPDREMNDFADARSPWRVFLSSDRDPAIKSQDLHEINARNPFVTELFPFVNPYHGKFYSISFPAPAIKSMQAGAPSGKLLLSFGGIFGTVELTWDKPVF